MILELREFDDFPVNVTLKADAVDLKYFSTEQVEVKSLVMELTIQHSDQEYYCGGEIEAESALECCRCLGSYSESLTGRTDFVVKSKDIEMSDSDDSIIDDELYVYFKGTGLQVEIGEPVRQAIILALPMHPLCSDNCKGLCTKCGKNLNSGFCGCKIEKIDSRWEGLNILKDLR